MVAYNERILQASDSPQRRHRADRMLANLRPELERLEREETERVRRIETVTPPASTFDGTLQRWREAGREALEREDELEVYWDGARGRAGHSLTEGRGLGSSLAPGPGHNVHLQRG